MVNRGYGVSPRERAHWSQRGVMWVKREEARRSARISARKSVRESVRPSEGARRSRDLDYGNEDEEDDAEFYGRPSVNGRPPRGDKHQYDSLTDIPSAGETEETEESEDPVDHPLFGKIPPDFFQNDSHGFLDGFDPYKTKQAIENEYGDLPDVPIWGDMGMDQELLLFEPENDSVARGQPGPDVPHRDVPAGVRIIGEAPEWAPEATDFFIYRRTRPEPFEDDDLTTYQQYLKSELRDAMTLWKADIAEYDAGALREELEATQPMLDQLRQDLGRRLGLLAAARDGNVALDGNQFEGVSMEAEKLAIFVPHAEDRVRFLQDQLG